MRIVNRILIFIIILILIFAGCVYYAFKIEPFRIKINEHLMDDVFLNVEDVKIAQISDIHIKADFTAENLHKVVTAINEQNPDIVVFTGDLYDNYALYNDDENIIKELKSIQAKYGKIAIWGNRDYGGGASRMYETIMEEAGFSLLTNENHYVTVNEGKKILFTGLDDHMLGNPHMPESTPGQDSDLNILLTHEPDTVENYLQYDYDLVLSGHSHGGQVDIPFLPMINEKVIGTTGEADLYNSGAYTLDNDAKTQLYVNTGIGTTHISARFGVVPEIAVFYR